MWKKPAIPVLLLLAAAVLAGCEQQPITMPDARAWPEDAAPARLLLPGQFEEPCSPAATVVVSLRNRAGEAVGELTVWNGPTKAYVRLTTRQGWEFTEVRVGGALQPEQFPRSGGVVNPRRFQFGGRVSPPQSVVVIEALHQGNPYNVQPGDEVLLAVFAQLQPVGGGAEVLAWAEGTPFQPGEHPMYFRYTLQACPEIDPSSITTGSYHTCGLTASGTAYCWGDNAYGKLGTGTDTDHLTPTAVAGGLTFRKLSAADDHTCGVTFDGRAYCWGDNEFGQLGDGTTIERHTPTLVAGGLAFVDISVGNFFHTCGLTAAGRAYCWGSNFAGRLGDGTTTDRLTPTPVAGGLTFAAISAGAAHSCGLTTAGRVYCWGSNGFGQLGDGTTFTRLTPTAVAGGLTFTAISAGEIHTCGIATDEQAYCWGRNEDGRLGDGTTADRLTPTAVAGGLTFADISAGGEHTCGVTTDERAYCWGRNEHGQLGDDTTTPRHAPTAVLGELAFVDISAGNFFHTCGLTTDERAYCWGHNVSGQLGDGTLTDRHTPTPVVGWVGLAGSPSVQW